MAVRVVCLLLFLFRRLLTGDSTDGTSDDCSFFVSVFRKQFSTTRGKKRVAIKKKKKDRNENRHVTNTGAENRDMRNIAIIVHGNSHRASKRSWSNHEDFSENQAEACSLLLQI